MIISLIYCLIRGMDTREPSRIVGRQRATFSCLLQVVNAFYNQASSCLLQVFNAFYKQAFLTDLGHSVYHLSSSFLIRDYHPFYYTIIASTVIIPMTEITLNPFTPPHTFLSTSCLLFGRVIHTDLQVGLLISVEGQGGEPL